MDEERSRKAKADIDRVSPPSKLSFCTRCGELVAPCLANARWLVDDFYRDEYSTPLESCDDPRVGFSTYACTRCDAHWVAVSSEDTGMTRACGHFLALSTEFCPVCGRPAV